MIADLSSIPGLDAKHLAVLADPLSIRTPGELLRADRRVIHAAMRRLRPRPTLEEISTWQDNARDVATASDPGWEQVAAFVVSFEQHDGDDDGPKRRIAAEQAEQAPPVPREVWPEWQCAAVCSWMLRQLRVQQPEEGRPEEGSSTHQRAGNGPSQEEEPVVDQPDNRAAAATTEFIGPRPALAIYRADLLTPGKAPVGLVPAVEDEAELSPGSQLKVTVSGSVEGQQVRVALRVRRPGHIGFTPHPPISTSADTPVEIDLSGLPPGTHTAVLAAWTDDGSAAPSVHKLPRLRVRGSPSK